MRLLARALLTVVLASAALRADAANVTGTVTSAASGDRLAGMVVAAYDASGVLRGTAGTDATGLYVLTIPAGDYRILAYDPTGVYATSFDANAESFETSPLRSIPAGGAQISFALVKGGAVVGRVQNAAGSPRAGFVVEAYNLSGTRRGFTSTNSTGDYSLVLPPGEYKLVAYDPAGVYAAAFHPGVRSFAEAAPVPVAEGASTPVAFTLGVAGRVNGTAIDAVTRLPLSSILIYAYTSTGALVAVTTTDASGAFRFALPAGDYRFVAADAARVYATAYYGGSRSFEGGQVVSLSAGGQRDGVQLALTRGARITGRVSAPNLLIAAYNLDGTLHASTTSDAAGNYTLVVAPGDYRIAVSDPSQTFATVFYGGTADFRFARTISVNGNVAGIDVTLPRGGIVSGVVREAVSGPMLSGINVGAYDASGTLVAAAVTGSDGRYRLVVAPGPYRFVAFDAQLRYATSYVGGATSYETSAPLVVEADTMITADFAMHRGVQVSGTVRSDDGVALTGVEVFALDASGNRAAGAVSKDGAFTIVVTPGTYRFIAIDPFRRYIATDPSAEVVVVSGGSVPDVNLVLKSHTRRRAVRH